MQKQRKAVTQDKIVSLAIKDKDLWGIPWQSKDQDLPLLLLGVWMPSLGSELRACQPCSVAKKKKKKKKTRTFISSLKMYD